MGRKVLKFEKSDFKYRNAFLNLELLRLHEKEKLIPKLLKCSEHLESSEAHHSCQRPSLKQEISIKKLHTQKCVMRTLLQNI